MRTIKKTKARSTKKSATKTTKKQDALIKANRARMALVERLQGLGLLDQRAVDKLEKKAESLTTKTGSAWDGVSSWDRALHTSLGNLDASAPDGNVTRSLQALITWQESLAGFPETRAGLSQAVTALKKVIPFHGASLYVRNPDEGKVEPVLSVGFEVQLISRVRFVEGSGFSSWVAARRKPVLYSSLHRNEAPGSEHVRSFMAVPLLVGGECVGVLNVGHREENQYDQGTLRRLMVAAGVLAGVVQRNVALGQIKAREIRDPATGLATTGYLRSRLEEEVVRCRELGHSMSLLTFRAKELPEYADQFGPDFRERCRLEMAALAAEWRLPTELVGHGNGDSLVVILPSARREKAEARAEALLDALKKHNFPRRKRMTGEYGIATYPADAEDSQELLRSVDKSLEDAARTRNGMEGLPQAMAM